MYQIISHSDVPERATERLGAEIKIVFVPRAGVDPDGPQPPQPPQHIRVSWHHPHRVPVQPPLPHGRPEHTAPSLGERGGARQTSKKTVSRSPCRRMSNLSSPSGSGTARSVARRACSPMEPSTGPAALAVSSSGEDSPLPAPAREPRGE